MGFNSSIYNHLHVALLLFLLLSIKFSCCHSAALRASCKPAEREALLVFKGTLTDPSNRLSSWTGRDCCTWAGVGCNNLTGHVVTLDLSNYHPEGDYNETWLVGSEVSSALANLKQLEYLDLSYNNFSESKIPDFFGDFKSLRVLNLSHASFGGVVPRSLGNLSALHDLWFSGLDLLILDSSQWLSRLTSLQSLHMSGMNLSQVPDALQNLTNLSQLTMADNHLSGHIPDWLSQLKNLQHLDFSGNSFSGSIPSSFCSMPSLSYLDMSENYLSGSTNQGVAVGTDQNETELNSEIEPYIPMAITPAQARDIHADFRYAAAPNGSTILRRPAGIQFRDPFLSIEQPQPPDEGRGKRPMNDPNAALSRKRTRVELPPAEQQTFLSSVMLNPLSLGEASQAAHNFGTAEIIGQNFHAMQNVGDPLTELPPEEVLIAIATERSLQPNIESTVEEVQALFANSEMETNNIIHLGPCTMHSTAEGPTSNGVHASPPTPLTAMPHEIYSGRLDQHHVTRMGNSYHAEEERNLPSIAETVLLKLSNSKVLVIFTPLHMHNSLGEKAALKQPPQDQ